MKLSDVNTTDIVDAIRLGCRAMSNAFDADDNDVPFFDVVVRPEARMDFSPHLSEAHVPGRHLNALLNAEDAASIAIDEDAVEKHERAAFLSYGGPVALPLNRTERGGPLVNFLAHNVREGFHALYALVKYRGSEMARELAEASIAAISDLWEPEREWDGERLKREHSVEIAPNEYYLQGLGRAIGPLVKYFRATGYGPALELAITLAEKATAESFGDEGIHDRETFGPHTHSTTCVMSGLAQLADLTSDSVSMSRVKAFYDNGLWKIRDQLGWVIESASPGADPDRGEVNNSGDILETALILGRWGYTDCYGDAERILRSHILPSQLRDVSFIEEAPNVEGMDGMSDVAGRLRGAFGFPAPYGHEPIGAPRIKFNMDIVGGAVGSLCEALRAATRRDEAGHWVNMLFEHEAQEIAVESPYTHSAMRIRVTRPAPLHVRIPEWVEQDSLKIEGVTAPIRITNGYAFIAEPPVNRWLTFEFPLAGRTVELKHRTRTIRFQTRGDAVAAMDDFGADLTYFDPL